MFSKILIANRGEIACRIMRTAQRLGIACVAVYSDADRDALFVKMADEAWHLGGSTPAESYLCADKIIAIAKRSGAQAIHPGYGFLSENANFAEDCARQGLVFIGPPVAAIELMGSKSTAKFLMEEAGVPLVPGYHGAEQDDERLQAHAESIGYPLLIKASAGGGGKGMRVVWEAHELLEALASARREAKSAFGNDKLLLERFITQPRHVEIQVFCDQHGNGVYLFERDCSVQRRHQKVIEEAPAPAFAERIRTAMGEAALSCAKAIQYVGAGTVEFLLDSKDQFYFMEMNTRLQVEHPITEMITGQDLVEWQLRIASGEPLPCSQANLEIRGHAFEARIYAEDPQQDFLPCAGRIQFLRTPALSSHVRIDSGVQEGDDIGVYYDPMIAKLVVWDEDRSRALTRLAKALRDYNIGGLKTNIAFLHRLATHRAFAAGLVHTNFIAQHRADLLPAPSLPEHIALMAAFAWLEQQRQSTPANPNDLGSPWALADHWRLNTPLKQTLELQQGNAELLHFAVEFAVDHYRIGYKVQGSSGDTTALQPVRGSLTGDHLELDWQGSRQQARVFIDGPRLSLFKDGQQYDFQVPQAEHLHADEGQIPSLKAPMNGRVISLVVANGQPVQSGDTLLIIEAMKMEHPIRAPGNGSVSEFFCGEGDLVQADQQLVAFAFQED